MKKVTVPIAVVLGVVFFAMLGLFIMQYRGANSSSRDAIDGVVVVATDYGHGTGFAIGEQGKKVQYIVTNNHVIADAYADGSGVLVVFSAAANRMVSAEIYWRSEQRDLAILRLPEPTDERKALLLCPSSRINMDDNFTALGFPGIAGNDDFKKYDKSDIVLTKGGIAKTARIAETDCYLLDLTINAGNSGGPLVNSKGEVVGVNSFVISNKDNPSVRANYAVSIDELLRNIDRNVIKIQVAGELTTMMLMYIIIGIVALIGCIVFLLMSVGSKSPAPNMAAAPAQAYAPVGGYAPAPQVTAVLTATSGQFSGQSFPISGTITIGRDPAKCTVLFPLDAQGISGTHCELSLSGQSVTLRDLGSSYGTFMLDGRKLNANQSVSLRSGEGFYLADGANKFQVRI